MFLGETMKINNISTSQFIVNEVLERLPHGEVRVHTTTSDRTEALRIASELNKSSGRYGSSFSVHTIDMTPADLPFSLNISNKWK